jgi:hypothetical protein
MKVRAVRIGCEVELLGAIFLDKLRLRRVWRNEVGFGDTAGLCVRSESTQDFILGLFAAVPTGTGSFSVVPTQHCVLGPARSAGLHSVVPLGTGCFFKT